MPDPIAINYSRELGWAASITALITAEPHESLVVVTYNFDGGREIGYYQAALPRDEFRRVLEAVRRSGYDRLPISTTPVPPETLYITVGEHARGETSPRMYGFVTKTLPPEIALLRDELEAGAIAEIRKHRARVVSGTAAWAKQTFAPNEPLAVRVTLANVGPLPFVIGNPLDPAPVWNGLSLALRNAAGDYDYARLNGIHTRPSPGAPLSPEATLNPGDSLSFGIEKKVYLPPATYDGFLEYRNTIMRDGDPQFVFGDLALPLGPVIIDAPRRW
jgi:hypothetical protein